MAELKSTRASILDTAKKCVCGDREQDYGTPERNFGVIAELWGAYKGSIFSPTDVAAMLSLVKIGRIASGHGKADNWIDLAGYAACGGEIESNVPTYFDTTIEHEISTEVITDEALEELFAEESVKGKYDGLSDKELKSLVCSNTGCSTCPIPNKCCKNNDSLYCHEFISAYPTQFRAIAIAYLEGLEGKE